MSDRFSSRPHDLAEVLPERRDLEIKVEGGFAFLHHEGMVGEVDLARAEVRTPASLIMADALVRAAVAWRLAQIDAVLLHASSVRTDSGAVVFFGRSGAGKSTIARAFGERAMCDELVRMDRTPGGWRASATPWWNGRGVSAPLHRLVWLVRETGASVRPVRGTTLLRALSREAGRYFPVPEFQRKVFELCADLAALGAIRLAAGEGRVVEDACAALDMPAAGA